jgi:hypothetical protein
MRRPAPKPWSQATSRHIPTSAAIPLRTSWRFKSSHPHSGFSSTLRPDGAVRHQHVSAAAEQGTSPSGGRSLVKPAPIARDERPPSSLLRDGGGRVTRGPRRSDPAASVILLPSETPRRILRGGHPCAHRPSATRPARKDRVPARPLDEQPSAPSLRRGLGGAAALAGAIELARGQ